MENKRAKLLEHYPNPEDKEIVKYYFELVENVFDKNRKKETAFLDPYKVKILENIVNIFNEVKVLAYGGFNDSERKKVIIVPSSWNVTCDMVGIDILSLKGNFEFDLITHRDVLGALMSLGIKREMLGDIIIGDHAINVAVDAKVSNFIVQNLYRLKRTNVEVELVNEQEIYFAGDYIKEINGTVASLRLDAVASVGFNASRNKMKELIKAQRVKLNWKVTLDPKSEVSEGDVVSLAGKGRVELVSIGKKSKKGRRHVTVRRYK